jgi:hypothetical protein
MPYALGPVKDHVRKAAEDIGAKFAIKTILGVGLRAGESDHPLGLALDFMTEKDMAKGQQLAEYVKANASAYGVKYVIWNQRIWSVERAAENWRLMEDRGSDTANHKDHVHVSFNAKPGSGTPGAVQSANGGTGGICGPLALAIVCANAGGITYVLHRLIGA